MVKYTQKRFETFLRTLYKKFLQKIVQKVARTHKQFGQSYADVITPAGCFANHGGGLQDDGSEYTTAKSDPFSRAKIGMCTGDPAFVYFFEFAATKFQTLDPEVR